MYLMAKQSSNWAVEVVASLSFLSARRNMLGAGGEDTKVTVGAELDSRNKDLYSILEIINISFQEKCLKTW